MNLVLNVYTDDSLTEVKRTVEADELKIPYRVAIHVVQSLDEVSLDNQDDLLKFVTSNIDKLDKVIKATFGITENELECINLSELIPVGKEIYAWVLEKVKGLNNGTTKNA